MERFRGYKRFLKTLSRSFARLSPERAPADLADRVMDRIVGAPEPAALPWGLKPAFAGAGMLAAACLVLWQAGLWTAGVHGKPEIMSFTVDKPVVRPAEPITLSWRVRNAKKVLIQDANGMAIEAKHGNSLTMYLGKPGEHTFVLIALGSDGSSLRKELQANP